MGGISGPRGAIRCVVMRYTARHAGAEIFAHLVFVGVAVGGANFEHMTWLSILFFGVVCMTYAIGYFKWFFWAYMTFQITVILGVLVMSLSDCLVFEDAYNDNGPTRYIAGNTGMHYLESVVVYALADRPTIQCGFDTAFVQIMLAFSISMVRLALHSAFTTSQCQFLTPFRPTGVVLLRGPDTNVCDPC